MSSGGSRVVLTLEGEEARAIMAIQKVIEKQRQMLSKTQDQRRESKAASDEMESGFSNVTMGIGKMAAAFVSLDKGMEIMRGIVAYAKELRETNVANTKQLDELRRGLMAQAVSESPALQAAVNEAALKTKTKLEDALPVAQEMISQGFTAEQVQGGALTALLEVQTAARAHGGTMTNMALPMATYLKSQGMELSAENISKVGRQGWGLYRTTSFQMQDLQEIAGVGALLKQGGLSTEMQLGAFTALKERGMAGPEAATALRNVVLNLSTAGADAQARKALKGMGLKPEDVDLVGEDLLQALDKIAGGLERMPEAKRMTALKQLFDKRGAAAAMTLTQFRGQIPGYIDLQGQQELYESAVGIMERGPAAREREFDVQRKVYGETQDIDLTINQKTKEALIDARARGASKIEQWAIEKVAPIYARWLPSRGAFGTGLEPGQAEGGQPAGPDMQTATGNLGPAMDRLATATEKAAAETKRNTDQKSKAPITQW